MASHRPDLNFIFPNAPNAPVSLNMGMRMPSWFDIKGLELSSPEDKEVRHSRIASGTQNFGLGYSKNG